MTNEEQPITIDADTARRMQLNAERNRPRYDSNLPTDSREATQRLNPFTGRPYIEDFSIQDEFDLFLSYDSIKREGLKSRLIYSLSLPNVESFRKQGNEAIELQKALGRMEVREGEERLGHFAYLAFVKDVRALADVYAQNPALTLDSITDVNGLNVALRAIQPPKDFGSSGIMQYILKEEIHIERGLFSKDKPWQPKHELREFEPRRGMASFVLEEF